MSKETLKAETLADLKEQLTAYRDTLVGVTIRKEGPRQYVATVTVEDAA
jgi:hypothetical protein